MTRPLCFQNGHTRYRIHVANKAFGRKRSFLTEPQGRVTVVQSKEPFSKVTLFTDDQGNDLAKREHSTFNTGSTLYWGTEKYKYGTACTSLSL